MKEDTGKAQYVILGMLARTSLTGYNMRKWIESEYTHFWQMSFGQIYPTLKRLVAQGLAEKASDGNGVNGRGQIVYSITASGRDVLSEWLGKEPDIEKLRYEILLKISFGNHTRPDVLLGHLDDFIKRNEALLQNMNHYLQLFDSLGVQEQNTTYSRLTALCGKSLYSAMRDWAVEAKQIIIEKGGSA